MLKIISITLLLIAACLVAVVIIRKIPQLSLIEAETVPKPKEEEVKKRILLERLRRKIDKLQKYFRLMKYFVKKITERLRAGWQKLKSLERYLKMKDISQVRPLMDVAESQAQENPEEAERIYLEIIKVDSKNIKAYEGLAELYVNNKQWDEAKETLNFLLKLNPPDFVKYTFQLAEIEFKNNNFRAASGLAAQIIDQGVLEPRYLDFFIEAAIMDNNENLAREGLKMLIKVNPENAKIGELEERIKNLPM